jgi:hypothetical protein
LSLALVLFSTNIIERERGRREKERERGLGLLMVGPPFFLDFFSFQF